MKMIYMFIFLIFSFQLTGLIRQAHISSTTSSLHRKFSFALTLTFSFG